VEHLWGWIGLLMQKEVTLMNMRSKEMVFKRCGMSLYSVGRWYYLQGFQVKCNKHKLELSSLHYSRHMNYNLTTPISQIDDTAVIECLLLCFLFDLVIFIFTKITNTIHTKAIAFQTHKISALKQQAAITKAAGLTKNFVELSKLERVIIREDKELTILNSKQTKSLASCASVTKKVIHFQYLTIFVLFYIVSRPLCVVGDPISNSNKELKSLLFPMAFRPVTIGSLTLPTGAVGGFAVLLGSRVAVKRVLALLWEVFNTN